jgi:sensor histidine kinase YesM
MKKITSLANLILIRLDFLAFIGLWIWLTLFQFQEQKTAAWANFCYTLLLLLPIHLPGLVFSWFKHHFASELKGKENLIFWICCFILGIPLLTMGCILLLNPIDSFVFITCAIANFLLALVLAGNSFYQKKIQHHRLIKKIKLENAILISLVLFAMVISAMAVSSMDNPKYENEKQLLIGFEFVFSNFIRYFGTFLSFTLQFLVLYLSGYLFFYLNSRFLVSKILKQKGLLHYLLSSLAIVAILYPIIGQIFIMLPINNTFGRDIFMLNPFVFENGLGAIAILLISLPVVLALQWGSQNQHILALEREKYQTELDLLKQQLNPHFFFNTLNNLYALSIQKSDLTGESILRLSELMRYTIYKGKEETVTLAQEVKYLEDYIELQLLRLHHTLHYRFEKKMEDDKLQIPPLLLIVLVENAFKHGIEETEGKAILNLSLHCTRKLISFTCENSFEQESKSAKPGIGLTNLRKRLALLYPENHELNISSDSGIFKVELQVKLA